MFDFYDMEVNKLFKQCEKEMLELRHPYVGTEHLLLSLLKLSSEINEVFKEYDLSYEKFKNELIGLVGQASKKSNYTLYTPMLKRVIKGATDIAMREKSDLTYKHFLIALLEEGEGIAIRIMIGMGIDLDSLYEELVDNKVCENKKSEILKIGKNLNELVNMEEELIGRDKEINYIMETLVRKDKNNPLLIGHAGVGKTAIIEQLARLINKGLVPSQLMNKKIIMIEMGSLVAGTKYRGEFEERLTNIIKELEKCDDLIIFIDEIHTMVNAGGAEGAINAADILKPYLARGIIKCIGATTIQEYNKFIASDKALARRFETINIMEPSLDETKNILLKVKSNYENHYNIKIRDNDLIKIVELTSKYIIDRRNPDKSLDVLDSVCSYLLVKNEEIKKEKQDNNILEKLISKKNQLIQKNDFSKAILVYEEIKNLNKNNDKKSHKIQSISEDDIYYVISKKINIPLPKQKQKLLSELKQKLNTKVLGQTEAITKILSILKDKYMDNSLPISFIFNGSSGVGKSYVSQLITDILKMNSLKLDFSDYSQVASLSRLIGTNAGYVGYDDEALINNIKYNPYSAIIIENYEYGCLEIKKLIEQILDEGIIKNAKGENISFKNTIIFINTNLKAINKVGFEHINQLNYNDKDLNKIINKVNEVIEFNKINRDIVEKYLEENNYDKNLIEKIDYENGGFKTVISALKKMSEIVSL